LTVPPLKGPLPASDGFGIPANDPEQSPFIAAHAAITVSPNAKD